MFQNFYPNKLIRSVYELDWEELSRTYGGVIFDIDNTLVPHGAPADERAICLFDRLRSIGFDTCLISNNQDPQPWHEDHAGIQQRRSAGKAFCTTGTD